MTREERLKAFLEHPAYVRADLNLRMGLGRPRYPEAP